MERIYTDTYDFERIRQYGGVYVDKTALIHRLLGGGEGFQFFLARPRRFGKSLLVSTIQRIFEGRRDLFEGLDIEREGWNWEGEKCPVLKISMGMCQGTMEQVERMTSVMLSQLAENSGLQQHEDADLPGRLSWLIRDAATASPTGKVVVLIDEYDKPLLEYVGTPEVVPYQRFLKQFYSVIKETEGLQRFCLITGVSKFSKVSIFSDLNNLVDLTMSPLSTTLLGYTHDEVKENFPGALEALAKAAHSDIDGAFGYLERWYDGYRFDEAMVPVFNPVSLGRSLADSRIKPYWFETGTPGWLMSYAKKTPLDVDRLELGEAQLGTFEPAEPDMTALLFQTGYLTIKGVEGTFGEPRIYQLGFPNREVADGFNAWLAGAYVDAMAPQVSSWQLGCRRALREGDVEYFVESLSSFFASIGYDVEDRLSEQAYQCVVLAILRFVGIAVSAEVTSSRGRADMVCESNDHVFVIELKVASGEAAGQAAARAAIAQIRNRGYAESYRADAETGRRHVQLLGLSFDCRIHNIAAWECEVL